ncbi:hypothetical protein TrST_g359 [Triparma strigata]|uniref:Sulfhydryl oxidase n=1 Tax=Triparma strigata TaxID=1606541 RepID=A0A9W7A152_9STRA|nr:hypothetical protein TrST_g359 [Triparma strigata]
MPSKKIFALAALLCSTALAAVEDTYEPADSKVNVLDYDNFHRFLDQHQDDVILMEFYAPWCGHCQQLAPQYREAAAELAKADLPKNVVLAKFDDGDDYNRRLRAGAPDVYNFTSYPSLFVLQDGEHERYGGGREADDIIFHMSAVAKGLDPYEEELKTKPGLYKDDPERSKYVRDLLDEEEMSPVIADSPKNVLRVTEFYSDRCPFCKSLASEYVEACKELKEKFAEEVECHAVNSRVFYDVAEEWEITGYPWMAFFYQGKKVEDMAGLGGSDSIVNWVSKMHAEHFDPNGVSPPPPPKKPKKKDGEDVGAPTDWSATVFEHTRFLLHSIAAKYPDEPTPEDEESVKALIGSLAHLFPSKSGANGLRSALNSASLGPIDTSSSSSLSAWMCSLENAATGSSADCSSSGLALLDLGECDEACHNEEGWKVEKEAPWSQTVYTADPEYHQKVLKTSEDAWQARELFKVLDLAKRLGIVTKKAEKKTRNSIMEGKKTQDHYLKYLSGEIEDALKESTL